jgi:hypothetical protein
VAKKDDDQGLPKFEDWLAPWEVDKDGNKLDEPAEVDPARIKKHLYNLLSDKTRLQETVADRDVQLAEKDEALKELQRQHENEEQRRERENKEREAHYAKLEAKEQERAKVEAIAEHFEEQGITSAQAKRLAKRVSGEDEKSWIEDARELVEDGFKIGSKTQSTEVETDDVEDNLGLRPIPRRANGTVAEPKPSRKKSVREEMEENNLFLDQW